MTSLKRYRRAEKKKEWCSQDEKYCAVMHYRPLQSLADEQSIYHGNVNEINRFIGVLFTSMIIYFYYIYEMPIYEMYTQQANMKWPKPIADLRAIISCEIMSWCGVGSYRPLSRAVGYWARSSWSSSENNIQTRLWYHREIRRPRSRLALAASL